MTAQRRRSQAAFRITWVVAASITCGGSSSTAPRSDQPPTQQPLQPQATLVASVPVPANYGIHDTFVRDGIAFVCAWNTGLILYDVGNGVWSGSPSKPVEISRIVTGSVAEFAGARVHNAWWFHNPVSGERRYVFVGQEGPAVIGASSTGDIHVVDVSNLAQPVEVASYHMAGTSQPAGTHNFWMDEPAQVLYAAYYNGGVLALDVSGQLLGNLAGREIARIQPEPAPFIWGVQLYNGSLYATDMVYGLYQLRLSGNTFTVSGGGNNVPERFSSDLWVENGFGYSGTWGSRGQTPGNALKIWRLSASGAPVLSDSLIAVGITTVSDVQVSADGKLLMFSTENGISGMRFYSLADPGHPVLTGEVSEGNGIHTATLADIGGKRYVFAAKDPPNPALLIFDITALVP